MLSLSEVNVVFTSPFQFINLAISCNTASGIILSFPVVLYQIMSFLRPALRKKDYNLIVRLIPFSLFLFVFGFIFGAMDTMLRSMLRT
jgi:Sec-independent protein secretion pathway component TatC